MDHDALTSNCVHMAWLCLGLAVICTVASWMLRPKDTVDAAVKAAANLSASPALAPPSAGDIAKVIDSTKGLIDSLSKASPLVAWLAAAVFFLSIAAFNTSDYSHKETPPAAPAPAGGPHVKQVPLPPAPVHK